MKLTKLCVLMLAFAGLLFVSCDKDDDSEKNGNGVVDLTLGLKSNYDGVLDLSFSKSNANIGFERVDVNLVNVKFNQFAVGGYDLGAIRIDSVSLSKSSVVRMQRDSQLVVLDLDKDGSAADTLYVSFQGEAYDNDSIFAVISIMGIKAMNNIPLAVNFYTGRVEEKENQNPIDGGEIWNSFDGEYSGVLTTSGVDSPLNIEVDKVDGYEVKLSVKDFPAGVLGNVDLTFEKIVVKENEDGTCDFSGSMKYVDIIDVNIVGSAKEKNAIEFQVSYAATTVSYVGEK
ncbi:MAG: calycin-like domain-containing protein [Paludibacteraceae bacterium]|nr:hypothetical protein [Prevotellaceae bacterium]